MNKPHIESLIYRFESENSNDKFDEAIALEGRLEGYEFELADGELTARPLHHFDEVEQARELIEPQLRSWESAAFLEPSRFRIRFIFVNAMLVDLEPDPGNTTIHLRTCELVAFVERVTVVRGMGKYPVPEPSFESTPFTDELIYRLQQYHDRHEPLPGVAYYILERLEQSLIGDIKNKRRLLGKHMKVQKKVFVELSRLSNRSDPKVGRHAAENPVPLSAAETTWMDAVIFRLVKRAGELHNPEEQIALISMDDFPPLP